MSERRGDLFWLALFLTVTVGLAREHFARTVDLENRGMKSVGTPDARNLAIRERLFGKESDVVVLVESPGIPPAELEAGVDALARELRDTEAVGALHRVPVEREGAELLAIELAADDQGAFEEPLEQVVGCLRSQRPPGSLVSSTGRPLAEHAIAKALRAEQERIVPVLVLLLGGLLFAFYRSLVLVLGALAASLAGLLWIGGFQHLLSIPLDPISALLPVSLLAIGVATSVHLLEHYQAALRSGHAVTEATRVAVRELRRPVLLTTVTTVAGFLALGTSTIPSVQRFAWLASLGVVLTSGMALGVLPIWIRLLQRRPVEGAGRRGAFVARLGRPGLAHPALVLVTGIGACLFLGVLGARLPVDTDPVRVLPARHPFRLETERVSEVLGGRSTLDVLLPPPHPVQGPFGLAATAGRLASVPDVLRLAGPPRASEDGTWLVKLLIEEGPASLQETAAAVGERARELGWDAPLVTGDQLQVETDSRALVGNRARAGLLTLSVLLVSVSLGFRSLRTGLLALVPNAIPCFAVYGVLALSGRPLTVPTAMIGSVMLGLIVDDTIHFLHAYRAARDAGQDRRDSAASALERVGGAMLVTSLVLAVGFGGGLLGELDSTREFSLLAAATILAALFANVILLPALLGLSGRRGRSRTLPETTPGIPCDI